MADEQEPDIRFSLANERTLLAYQRTAIGLIAAAVAVVHFLDNKAISVLLAAILLASGGVAAVGGYERYRAADRAIREGSALPSGHAPIAITFGLTLCLLVAAAYVVIHVA
ncbi:MAG TPA: DUF202 domain-containing protein [Marmoricola sp.]|nr:DUF202 domain-containing protein [Marmoricola sp.]